MRCAVAVLALALGACAAEPPKREQVAREWMVVLPGPDGKAGSIVVSRAGQEQVLDRPFASARVQTDGTLKPVPTTRDAVHATFATTLEAMPPKPTSFQLYFLEGKDEFTAESKREIERILDELKRRPAPDIVVIGHSDTVGGDTVNDRLSLQRAERVKEILSKILNLPAERVQSAGRGKRELLVPTADNISEPKNRRVEISVR